MVWAESTLPFGYNLAFNYIHVDYRRRVFGMPLFKVRVKWGKHKFEDVELSTDEPPMVFKMQLFSLSGVPPERQKVMVAGGTLPDDDWGKTRTKIKQNMMLMMMGSAEDLPEAPKEKPRFIEDMSEAEAASALALPSGLENFGNTCYMNATLQCLKVVPELRACLKAYVPPQHGVAMATTAHSLTAELQKLYDMMDRNQAQLPLLMFMQSLHSAVPQFAEKDERTGVFRQQDAHECWSSLMTYLAQTLSVPRQGADGSSTQEKFMEQYFGVQLQTTYKCLESQEEMETSEVEKNYQISCFISQDTKYTHTAIQKGLEGSVEKQSPSLGRNAQYSKSSRVSRLPAYLAVQFVRFHVGKAANSDEIISKKILKDVKFTLKLDMYDFCSPSLQKKLLPVRTRFKEVEDKKAAIKAKMIAEGKLLGPKQKQKVEEAAQFEPFDFPDDTGSNSSGLYDLVAVLTHQGRSSSSGHYLGWVRHRGADWLKLDDDKVSMVTEEDILKLSGGGDWHVAYILLYAARRLERLKEQPATDSEQAS